ncbi:CPBP family intramembrane glutamic endopeptidase [Clostridium sp. ZS2-4]|uniref:CPBP family intramembrane glutamic endopeptidase n=1 Tax=Clostridium sp. ZS2-4 TaxID=2987703 RepID=UPI00227A557C|nr:CPBP family intramembrane glutamic endopeptidase [Clostridium sp. ZS2-4]MCY6355867.1 CPBP family intramembrane metalloprotease [Clostridium sp. ZS2-4]
MRILTNKNNQIRSGYKVTLFTIIYIIFTSIFSGIFGGVLGGYMRAKYSENANYDQTYVLIENYMRNSFQGMFITQLLGIIALFLTLFIVLKGFEKKRFKDIGLNSITRNWKGLIWGLMLGAISMSVIFIMLLSTGDITLENSLLNPQLSKNTVWGILIFIIVAINEETMCRGYILNTLNQMGKPWVSAAISSGVFAALHLLNPNVKLIGILNIFLVGMLFAYMYIRTNSLWMPIGYHFTWNYFQGSVFGFAVSGTTEAQGIYNIASVNENIFTGGSFGPEAGILATVVLILGFVVVWKVTNKEIGEEVNFR